MDGIMEKNQYNKDNEIYTITNKLRKEMRGSYQNTQIEIGRLKDSIQRTIDRLYGEARCELKHEIGICTHKAMVRLSHQKCKASPHRVETLEAHCACLQSQISELKETVKAQQQAITDIAHVLHNNLFTNLPKAHPVHMPSAESIIPTCTSTTTYAQALPPTALPVAIPKA